MRLDVPTLFLMTVAVTFMVGALFLLSWSQTRRERALAIWGIAHLAGSVASCLLGLRGAIPDPVSIGLGNAVMIGAYGLIWSGVRAFEGRRPLLGWALAGSFVWLGACFVPAFYASLPARIIVASIIAGSYCALGAWTVWRGRGEPLVSRYPPSSCSGPMPSSTGSASRWPRSSRPRPSRRAPIRPGSPSCASSAPSIRSPSPSC